MPDIPSITNRMDRVIDLMYTSTDPLFNKETSNQLTMDNNLLLKYMIEDGFPEHQIVEYLSSRYDSTPVVLRSPHVRGTPRKVTFPDLQHSFGINFPSVSPQGHQGWKKYRWPK